MQVVKRNGLLEELDINKVQRAVKAAFASLGRPMPTYLI